MHDVAFTEKQKWLIRKLKNGELKRINLLYGSVRSGKTWITLVCFALWVITTPEDSTFLMCARTITTLKRNCLDLLQDLVGVENFKYTTAGKVGTLFGRKVYLEGANDARSESKIRGMTLQGAYVDEITLIEQDFFNMLLSRLSRKDAKLFGSTNPDSPYHWLKTDFIDRADELNMLVEKYLIDDNTFLDPEYVKEIKTEYTGVFYRRFIEGEFALAEGLIYPMYEDALVEPFLTRFSEYGMSIDYGTQNAFAALLWGRHEQIWYVIDEYYYSGRETGRQKTDEQYYQDLLVWLNSNGLDDYRMRVVIDPSAASFITLMRQAGKFNVIKANNDVIDGIRETATCLQNGKVKVFNTLTNMIKEFQSYVWDEGSGIDRPVKELDHCMDSARYWIKTMRIAKADTRYNSLFGR